MGSAVRRASIAWRSDTPEKVPALPSAIHLDFYVLPYILVRVQWLRLAPIEALPPGHAASVDVDGHTVAIFHTEAGLYAVDNDCLHMGGPLCEGTIDGTVVTCPWHAWSYDVTTGERVDRRGSPLPVHRVGVDDGWIVLAP